MSPADPPVPPVEPKGDRPGPALDGEAALYRMLFAVAAVFYVGWWPVNRFAMNVAIDPLWERCAIGAIAAYGYVAATRPGVRRYSPQVAEVVIYAITLHYFSLIVRNGFSAALQIGVFITLASVGLVPRTLPRTITYSVATTLVAAIACSVGSVDLSVWSLVFGGVVTIEAVAFAIAVRLHGITVAREQAERALLAAKDTAERAVRTKRDLLAKVSHELRTPMNGVINMVQLAHDAPLTPLQSEYLETATACAGDMLRIIDDLLDLSKAEAGRMALHPTRFSLAEVLERALKELALRAASKGIAMQVTVRPDVPDRLVGDGLRLQQVLVNLIGNAVKFTEGGTIDVEIARAADPALAPRVRLAFRVSDTGPGIAPEALERIFVAFAQADGSVTRRYGGTGLGLTISSELVELMGGRLAVDSHLGAGSTFRFEATFEPATTEQVGEEHRQQPVIAPPTTSVATSPRLAVLLAEDNSTNQRIVRAVLERAGHEVEAVGNGTLALEALARREFAVVLLDVQMPDLDGNEVARRIRAGAVPGKEETPLVAITAQAVEGDRERCLAAGMSAYLAKPVDRDLLIATVERLAAPRTAAPSARDAASAAAIDDVDLMRRLGNDHQLLAIVLSTYRQTSPPMLASLGRAVDEQAAGGVEREAHSLKGSLLTLGAKDAAQAAATLEHLGRSGRRETFALAFTDLLRELTRLDACIEHRFGALLEESAKQPRVAS